MTVRFKEISLKGLLSKAEGMSHLTRVASSVNLDENTAETVDQLFLNFELRWSRWHSKH